MKKHHVLFLLLLTGFSCSKKNDEPEAIMSDFKIYVDRFVSEAKSRNVDIDISNIKVGYITPAEAQGYCGLGTHDPAFVKITQSDNCWYQRSDADKEILMFHEMGHALLRRDHVNDTLANGDYKSMMFEGNQFYLYSAATPERRKYYLDELFDTNTLPPSWAVSRSSARAIINDSIAGVNLWKYNPLASTHTATVASDVFFSTGHSLSITGTINSPQFSFWSFSFVPDAIVEGSGLVLRVKVKTEGVTGGGAYVALRCDVGKELAAFATTQGKSLITGTKDFTEYKVRINYFPAGASISVFLILDSSATGTVYFDDVQLINDN